MFYDSISSHMTISSIYETLYPALFMLPLAISLFSLPFAEPKFYYTLSVIKLPMIMIRFERPSLTLEYIHTHTHIYIYIYIHIRFLYIFHNLYAFVYTCIPYLMSFAFDSVSLSPPLVS